MVIGIDASRAFISEKTGTENYSFEVIKQLLRLPESSAHTFVLFTRPNAIIPTWTKQKNVKIQTIKLKYLWTQVGLAWETWKKFEIRNSKLELDVLWIPAHTLPILRKPGINTVVTIHGLEYRWLPEYRNWLQRWYLPLSTYYAVKHASGIIAVSGATKNDILSEIKTDAKNLPAQAGIKVILEGVISKSANQQISKSAKKKILEKYGLKENDYVLFVGTIQPRKNLISLIQAWEKVGEEEHKLVIAGGVGWMAEEVLQEVARLGVGDRVVFTGRINDLVLQALYHGAKLYVQPSWTEGFGLPVLEAMRAGVAVVASDGGALPEVVGEAGVVVPLKNDFVSELAIALKRLITHKNERDILIARGYKRIKKFTWEKTAKETLLILTGEGDSKSIVHSS